MLPPVEDYILGRDAAALMGVSTPTFKRYYLYGYRGVRLSTVLIGGKRATTRDWIDAFIEGVTATDYSAALCDASDACDGNSIEAARDRLRAEGILPSSGE